MVAALLFANVACACAPSDKSSEPTSAHHHTANQDDTENTPCPPPQDCDGCDELLDQCTTADSSLTPTVRDGQALLPQKIELDGPDLDLAILDTGQTWGLLTSYIGSQPGPTLAPWVIDTPIRRKDQLTE